jgi:glycosyltransferase involved in cell wall biosynthesis
VPFNDPDCPVQIYFSQPEWYDFHPNQYKIGYTPWESTGLPENWVEDMQQCDEVWTASPLIAKWFKEAGVSRDVHVYEHGVDKVWTPKRRRPSGPIRFLHMGEPAPRKGGELALQAFRAAFGDSTDVQLTIKAHAYNTLRVKDRMGSIIGLPHEVYNNVKLVVSELTTEALVGFVQQHDVLVYPSYGEGFGLIPIQAMATGMPTICTEAWAPYANYLIPELRLSSMLGDSPWPVMHPGKVFFPNFDHLVDIYKYTFDNFTELSAKAYRMAYYVGQDYDWDTKTREAFKHIVEMFP